MLILAISIKGSEFMYNAHSAHKIPKRSAEKIKDTLNRLNYHLKEGETWFIHEVDQYDTAYYIAEEQTFTIYKNHIHEKYQGVY